MSNGRSAAERALEHASYVAAYATGNDGLKAKATAAEAEALVDLAESIRFHAILTVIASTTVTPDNVKLAVALAKALSEVCDP